MREIRNILLLAVLIISVGCGGKGSKYVGRWECLGKHGEHTCYIRENKGRFNLSFAVPFAYSKEIWRGSMDSNGTLNMTLDDLSLSGSIDDSGGTLTLSDKKDIIGVCMKAEPE
jgi:hypothetical protein